MKATMQQQASHSERPAKYPGRAERVCVGCGLKDEAASMVRLVVEQGWIAFDLAGGAFGRGAHVHPRPSCLEKAPRGLSRAFRGEPSEARDLRVDAPALGQRLVDACDRRLAGLLLAARRARGLVIGADSAGEALRQGAPLAVVAVDAGGCGRTSEVERAIVEGRAVAWKSKKELGSLLGEEAVAICVVRPLGIAREIKTLRAAAAAGAATTREGAECSMAPEAR